MAKRGRPVTDPRTIQRILLENPPEHISRRVAERKLSGVSPWAEVIETGERHHEAIEAIRKKLEVGRSDLDRVLAGYSEGATEEQLNKAWSVLEKRREKISADASLGGRTKALEVQPKWHSEVTRLAKKIESSRAGIEVKLSNSQLAKLILARWDQPAIDAPSHKTLRVYLGKLL